MKRIVIADDDVIVRRYLQEIIQNEMQGFQLCGIAKNGSEALKLIKEQKPDLAIIDIDMPEKDGVEVLYELKEQKLATDTKVVVLSCYNDFDYVKNAMKYGAVDYILKYKVDAQTLASLLESVFSEIRLVQFAGHKNNNMESIEHKDKLLRRLLFQADEENNQNHLAESLDINPENLLIAVGMMDYHDKFIIHNSDDAIKKVNSDIMDIIQKTLVGVTGTLTACIDEDKYVIIFSGKTYINKQQNPVSVKHVLTRILSKVSELLRITLTFGVSDVGGNITNIAAYYMNALKALDYKLYVGTNCIIWYSECFFASEIPDDLYKSIDAWSKSSFDSAESGKLLQDIFAIMMSLRLPYSLYQLLLLRMVGVVLNRVENQYSMSRIFGDLDMTMVFWGCETCQDYHSWLCRHINQLQEDFGEQRYRGEISEAITFIKEHLGENLTLSIVAEHVNFSKNYFSQLFKQNTGENLVDYVARLRINRAKELLLNSNYKVYEIAGTVGFESQHYFNRLFKSLVGLTPTEYRNIKQVQ